MKLEQYLDIIDDVTKKNYISTLNILNQKLVKMGILRLFSNKLMAMLKLNFKSRSFHHICLTLGSTGFHIVPTYKKLPQNLCHTPHYQLLEELITVTVILQGSICSNFFVQIIISTSIIFYEFFSTKNFPSTK